MTWANNLFYFVFVGQILLLSYYFPEKLLGRINHVLENYPPSEYPRLYPQPIENYRNSQWVFKVVSRSIFALGFLLLGIVIYVVDHASFADDGFISEAWPAGYGMIQFLPLVMLELSEFGQLRRMRASNTATTRKAELSPRRLFDIVSPLLVVMTFVLYLGSIVLDLYVHDFTVSWGHDTVQRALVLTVSNVFIAILGSWNLYGRKLNPHQSSGDRARQAATALNSLLYLSMAMSVFFMTQAIDDVFALASVDATLMSLYFQVIAFLSIGYTLRNLRLEDHDFDVYRDPPAVS